MLQASEKIKLLKIFLIFLIILLATTAFYVNSYLQDLKLVQKAETKKVGKALIEKDTSNIFQNLNIALGYDIKVFANTFKEPVSLSPGPFDGILVADQGFEGAYQLVDNTADDISDFNTRIIVGFTKVSAVLFQNPHLYISDQTGVYKYDYNALQAEVSDREKIFNSSFYENKEIIYLRYFENEIYIFTKDNFVYKGSENSSLTLLSDNWLLCKNGNVLDYPCFDQESDLAKKLTEAISFETAFFISDDKTEAFFILKSKNQKDSIVKVEVKEGKLIKAEDVITGWGGDADLASIEFSSNGDLFVSDKKNRNIYKIIKINN